MVLFSAASGPVRLFTPYKRRRKNLVNHHESVVLTKIKKQEDDSENDQSIVTKEETNWQTITDGIDASNDYLNSTTQSENQFEPNSIVCFRNVFFVIVQTISQLCLKQSFH